MFLVLGGLLVMQFSWGFLRSLLPFHFYLHSTNVGREKTRKRDPTLGSVEEKGLDI